MKNELTNWYVASVHAPHSDNGLYRGWMPCIHWCREIFGGSGLMGTNKGNGWRYYSEGVFEFENEIDRTAFLLRWS